MAVTRVDLRRVGQPVLLARSLWSKESERSTGSFADFYERPAGHVNGHLPCLGMEGTLRARQTYDHTLRDVIAATGSADLFFDGNAV